MVNTNVYAVPILERYLVYAPLQAFSALVNEQAVQALQDSLSKSSREPHRIVAPITQYLSQSSIKRPQANCGPVRAPYFLGIIPTRGCNMGCRYCDFSAPKADSPQMSISVARAAVDAYIALLKEHKQFKGEIQFFGGEPFYAEKIVHFVVGFARWLASQANIDMRFEATTNGLFSREKCQWVADHFHTIVLSLDGPEYIQTRHRPAINGHSVSDIVIRNGKIFSQSNCDLVIRSCVTQETVAQLPKIAQWIVDNFSPISVCFESMVPSPISIDAGLMAPDPWLFSQQFCAAESILARHNIKTVMSTANINRIQVSFCPVGRDALIVLPDGKINACYLLEESWQTAGLDMRLGNIDQATARFQLDQDSLKRVRAYQVENKPGCADCFCRFHCAGGCHVNHPMNHAPGNYDALCVQTRLITIFRLLQELEQNDLIQSFFANQEAMKTAVFQPDDKLLHQEL